MKSILLPALLAGLLLACGSDEPAEVEVPDDNAPGYIQDEQVYMKAAKNVVGAFSRDLKSELMSALNASGADYALQICQIKAPEIAAAHTHGGWSIKRVSNKFRNPGNRPDTAEVRILGKFADTSYHQEYYQDWYGPDSSKTFRYCRRIEVAKLCLQCHGDLQTLDRGLYVQVKSLYPWDKATGYHEGDLRGMFVVEAPWPQGKELAEMLAQGVTIPELTQPDTLTDSSVGDEPQGGDSM